MADHFRLKGFTVSGSQETIPPTGTSASYSFIDGWDNVEIASILASGMLRLRTRGALYPNDSDVKNPPESSPDRLEMYRKIRLQEHRSRTSIHSTTSWYGA